MALSLAVLLPAAPAHAAGFPPAYVVSDVPVDATADSSVQAREAARGPGRPQGIPPIAGAADRQDRLGAPAAAVGRHHQQPDAGFRGQERAQFLGPLPGQLHLSLQPERRAQAAARRPSQRHRTGEQAGRDRAGDPGRRQHASVGRPESVARRLVGIRWESRAGTLDPAIGRPGRRAGVRRAQYRQADAGPSAGAVEEL